MPGDLGKSELFRRISAQDAPERMPPVKSGKTLSPEQIRASAAGSPRARRWQPHWSFVPPRRPVVPPAARDAWVRNPVDAFVLARLGREAMAPAPAADRGVWIRRVSLDLTGLPPTRAEIEAFERDGGPDAYEKVVDRLLASPRLGERLAARWLNAARYADTSGYQTDGPRVMWRWRDWVIEAFNRNLPFDQFTVEQLAGDLIPGATLDQKIATGFNRNHRGNSEGGIIPEEYAVEYVVDRVDTTATVWLGLTLACARCHSHKFDPIPQEDFYKFYAYFNNIPENGRAIKLGNSPPLIKSPTRLQAERLETLRSRLAVLEHDAIKREPEMASAQAAWERSRCDRPAVDAMNLDRLIARPAQTISLAAGTPAATSSLRLREGSPRFVTSPDGPALALDGSGYLDCGDAAGFGFLDRFTLMAWIKPRGARGGTIWSRMLDEPQAEGYSVVLDRGKVQVNLVKRWLDDAIRIETTAPIPEEQWTHLAITYDGSRTAAGARVFVNGTHVPADVLIDELNQTFQSKEPFRIGAGGGPSRRFAGAIGATSVYSAALEADDVAIAANLDSIASIARLPASSRSKTQAEKLRRGFLAEGASESVRSAAAKIAALRDEIAVLVERIPTTMVMEEMPAARDASLDPRAVRPAGCAG